MHIKNFKIFNESSYENYLNGKLYNELENPYTLDTICLNSDFKLRKIYSKDLHKIKKLFNFSIINPKYDRIIDILDKIKSKDIGLDYLGISQKDGNKSKISILNDEYFLVELTPHRIFIIDGYDGLKKFFDDYNI